MMKPQMLIQILSVVLIDFSRMQTLSQRNRTIRQRNRIFYKKWLKKKKIYDIYD